MDRLGVLGGMGPMATVYFLQRVTEMTDAVSDQQHIETITYSCPSIPDRTSYILDNGAANPLPEMAEKCRLLERLGADIIAIPCVTAHYFYKELSKQITIPIINLPEETARYLAEKGVSKAGIMATDGTVSCRLTDGVFEEFNIESIYPDDMHQRSIMEAICSIKSGKAIDMEKVKAALDNLYKKGAETVLLGCTELSLLKRDRLLSGGCLDVIDILARSSVLKFGRLKKKYDELMNGD